MVQQWKSDDIGDREPLPADFLVELPPETRVDGVADASNFLTDGKFDIEKVHIEDLIDGPSKATRALLGIKGFPSTDGKPESDATVFISAIFNQSYS